MRAGGWVNFNECNGSRVPIVPIAYEGHSSWLSLAPILKKAFCTSVIAADWCGKTACHEASAYLF